MLLIYNKITLIIIHEDKNVISFKVRKYTCILYLNYNT